VAEKRFASRGSRFDSNVTASAKIGWSAVCGAVIAIAVAASVETYFAISFERGITLWDEGVLAADRGDLDTAISKYTAALSTRLGAPCAGIVYMNRGIAYNGKGLIDRALLDFGEALRLNPDLAEAHAGRSFAHISKGEIEEALEDANEALKLDPNSRDAYHNRAIAFLNRREFPTAIADLGEAIRCDPHNAALYIERANAFLQDRQYDAAIACYESAIRISPEIAAARQWRDYAWEKRAYELLNQGITAASQKKYDEALRFYDHGLQSHPGVRNRAVLLCNRATTLGHLERREESGRDYDEAIRLDPNFFQAYFNRGINHRELGRIPEAIRDFSEALRLNPKFAPAYVDRAAIYLHQNNAGAAYADWLKVLENIDTVEVEHRPRILNDIAWWLATSPAKLCRDGKTALRAAMQACELSHWTRSDVLDTLAAAYAETGDFGSAISWENQALQLTPASSPQHDIMKQRLRLYQQRKPYRASKRS
jgi:tetratricopeptide (TPR) repeat protein